MTYTEFFRSLTGHAPFPWQERLQDDLASGRSVILRIPTGAGKTWGAVAPFLYGLKTGNSLADRLLYALPLRSLASSLHATVSEKMSGEFGAVISTGKDRDYQAASPSCSLQIGGQKNDPFFESDVVFTTIDQLLSGYVFLPVSLPDRLGNINAGALIGSLIVFDELHLLDPDVALGTVIEMLDRLKGLCQFVLMTATMSDNAMSWLAGKLGGSIVQIADEEIRALPAQRTKHRTWRYSDLPISAKSVHASHVGGRTIVLMNSVKRAQDLFLDLERLYAGKTDSPELILLHARYYPEDRAAIECRLEGYFGPAALLANVILVTTQVVEAGMDISAEQLHTEIAPMSALIQRAGRTARYESRSVGFVTVYRTESPNPYKDQLTIVEATREKLGQLPRDGKLVDFIEERSWIDDVHAGVECQKLASYSNLFLRRKLVHEAMDLGERGRLTDLVRDISSVGVLIAENPEHVDFGGRAWPKLLGTSGFSLMSLRESFSSLSKGQWVAKGATEQPGEGPSFSLQWNVLASKQLPSQWLVALHPDFASYRPRYGLMLGIGGPAPPIEKSEQPPFPRYQYEFETWADHARRVAEQARSMRRAYGVGAESLAREFDVSPEWIEELVEVICILHDVGKLAEPWQTAAWRWQNDKDSRMRTAGQEVPARPDTPIAHTWLDPVVDRDWRRKPEYKLPPHAVEGAFTVSAGLSDRLTSRTAACGYTSVARHHGPRSKELRPFRFCVQAQKFVAECLPAGWQDLPLHACNSGPEASLFSSDLLTFSQPDDTAAWPLYSFIIRRLRLADQASLRERA